MTVLASKLSQLEIEPLEIVHNAPLPEQNKNLETLTHAEGKGDPLEVLMLGGTMPVASGCSCGSCGSCGACGCCSSNCLCNMPCACTCSCLCVA